MSGKTTYTRWAQVPENLKTKTQLDKEHLKPVGDPVAKIKTGYGLWDLYDATKTVEKLIMTDAKLEALKKARETAYKNRCCEDCGNIALKIGKKRPKVLLCDYCKHNLWLKSQKEKASDWARKMLSEKTIILDTETTGLEGEIVEIAIIDMKGNGLYNRLVHPTTPIEPGAMAVHGITDDDVADVPGWAEQWPTIQAILAGAKNLVIYNSNFDLDMLRNSSENVGIVWDWSSFPEDTKIHCAMLEYARWYGHYSDYHKSFRWQKLPSAGHRAMDDCLATLELLKEMAGKND